MEDIYFQGFWRMDWGLGNPNKTAALIATLLVGVWIFSYFRKWGFWLSLVLATGLSVCLIHTFSRGGLIAAAAGLAVVAIFAPRPWAINHTLSVIASVWVIVGVSVYLQAPSRYGQGLASEDRSITNRLELWKAVPSMMVDAPSGWGIGNSGKAYMEWYQPLEKKETYRTLVSSHLTWMTEFGWIGRFLYVSGWLWLFVICLPMRDHRWTAVPFAVLLTFFISAFFSSVAESIVVWVMPCIAAISMLVFRAVHRTWPRRFFWLGAPAGAAAVLLGATLFADNTANIHKDKNAIRIGGAGPDVWVIVNEKVLGASYGRTLREYLAVATDHQVGLVTSIDDLPEQTIKTLIVAGSFGVEKPQRNLSVEKVVLVNPSLVPAQYEEFRLPTERLSVKSGEFALSSTASAWKDVKVNEIPGVGDFVSNWAGVLLGGQTP